MRDPMRLWSPFAMRARASGGSPPPAFDPASLFSGSDGGFVLDLARDTLSTTTPGVDVSSITTFVRSIEFFRGGSGRTPKYQLDGSLPYLQFDGVDDWMATSGGLLLGATDAVTVIAAMRRGQNVNVEDVFGIGVNPQGGAYPGAFCLASTVDAGTDNAGFTSQGNPGGAPSFARAASTSVATNYVVTGIADISADTCIARRNGVQIQSTATDQGSGNWGVYDAYLGARGGTSRFFNGRLYALIVINRVLTAGELASAEAWAASKCGVTL